MLLETVFERSGAAHHKGGHRLGDLVPQAVRVAEHAGCVAHRGPCFYLREGDDLSDAVAAVLLGRVADHRVAVASLEIHVDVGHGEPRGVQEALEQQVVLDRIQIGDLQGIGDRAPCCGSPPGAHSNVVVTREPDEVPGDQEIGGETHAVDHRELKIEPFDDVWAQLGPPTAFRSGVGEVAQVFGV